MSNTIPSLINSLYQKTSNQESGHVPSLMNATKTDHESRSFESNNNHTSVSLSLKAQKLSAISAEFFNGVISSDRIEALTQSLYENGFLSDDEMRSLGQNVSQQGPITQSKKIVSDFMLTAESKGDDQTLSMLKPIAKALNDIDNPLTSDQRKTEIIALENANQILSKLKEFNADSELVEQFESVVEVLSTLDTMRKNDKAISNTAEYEAIQNGYDQS